MERSAVMHGDGVIVVVIAEVQRASGGAASHIDIECNIGVCAGAHQIVSIDRAAIEIDGHIIRGGTFCLHINSTYASHPCDVPCVGDDDIPHITTRTNMNGTI